MTKKMLIDATHEEETRVAIVENGKLEEFDYESLVRQQIKGNIYLAKVTRVEPSLQAAFVNYGGNRHGFLPFSEIHPDYFRIPISDRQALIEQEKAQFQDEDDDDEDLAADDEADDNEDIEADESDDEDEEAVVEVGGADKPADDDDSDLTAADAKAKAKAKTKDKKKQDEETEASDAEEEGKEAESESESDSESDDSEEKNKHHHKRGRRNGRNNGRRRSHKRRRSDELVDEDDGRSARQSLRHKYKIQEVIKRGQIMLIQVSKEERGNKGAAVTSYLSLPGRYCVLMPNSPRGGGVSRKIGNFKDRKRMREILKELTIPDGMSVILRTAGVSRTKAEIKRDLDYLMRLWNRIREETLQSSAPALINEEGNLIKRSIRDLYTRDIDEVLVSGEKGYKTAKDFMKMLVPSHAKKVKEYAEDRIPLYHRYQVENQISEIGEMSVQLKSGGYLVINPTEALVAVDVNSGRATKERHIEETALKTNLEAAKEVARQLRLRDLGGLVVIDFIDMEDRRNNRKVENKLRDALSEDRARIQVGRISSFGLLELSRQRLNPSLTEAQFEKCPHCEGTGFVKSLDFAAITALRALVEEGIKGQASEISLKLPSGVAIYISNNKRQTLVDIEALYGFKVHLETDDEMKASDFELSVLSKKSKDDQEDNDADETEEIAQEESPQESHQDDNKNKKHKRGRRGGRRNRNRRNNQNDEQSGEDEKPEQADDSKTEKSKKSSRKSSKKSAQKSTRKTSQKSSGKEADEKESSAKEDKPQKAPAPSNDDGKLSPAMPEQPASDYEVVNEAPKKKKKGWWNKLLE